MALLSEETGRQIAGTAPATAPQTLITPTALPAAGALLGTIVSVDVPAGKCVAIFSISYTPGDVGGAAIVYPLFGSTANAAATAQYYMPAGQGGAFGAGAVAGGSVLYCPIPPGITRISCSINETGNTGTPGTAGATLWFA